MKSVDKLEIKGELSQANKRQWWKSNQILPFLLDSIYREFSKCNKARKS